MHRVTKIFRYHRVLKRAGVGHKSRDLVLPSTGKTVLSGAEVDAVVTAVREVSKEATLGAATASDPATAAVPGEVNGDEHPARPMSAVDGVPAVFEVLFMAALMSMRKERQTPLTAEVMKESCKFCVPSPRFNGLMM